MQLDKIVDDFNFNKILVFDKEAIVIYQNGDIDDIFIVELTDFYKQMAQFEIVKFNEVSAKFQGQSIIGRKLNDCYLTVILEEDEDFSKNTYNFYLLFNRLKRELF